MLEPLTFAELVAAGTALFALLLSIISLIRTSKVQRQQLRLQEKQEELTDLQLEHLRKQVATASGQLGATQPEADVRVDLERSGRGHKFFITNWGQGSARDVTFDLDLPDGANSPLMASDYAQKIPIPELAPGSRVPLHAVITLGMAPNFPARWTWLNPDGARQERKTTLAL